MAYFEFPHSRTYEGDLGYIIKKLNEFIIKYDEFYAINKIKVADPIAWDISSQYEPYTIVVDYEAELSFIAKQPVPAGINLSNTDYWEQIGSLTVDAVARDNITEILKFITNGYETGTIATANRAVGDLVIVSGKLYKVSAVITTGNTYVEGTNIVATTIESELDNIKSALDTTNFNVTNIQSDINTIDNEIIALDQRLDDAESDIGDLETELSAEAAARENEDGILDSRITALATLSEGSTTGDAELMDIRTSSTGITYPNAGDAVRAQATMLSNKVVSTRWLYSVLTHNGYLTDQGNIVDTGADNSFKYSDMIDIHAYNNGDFGEFAIYQEALGYNHGGTHIANIIFYDSNSRAIAYSKIQSATGSSGETYVLRPYLPRQAYYMRLCSSGANTSPFEVSLYKKPNDTPATYNNLFNKYYCKEAVTANNNNGYIDTDGAANSAPGSWWYYSNKISVKGFNTAYYSLYVNSGVSAVALYSDDDVCIKRFVSSSSSYVTETGFFDVSEGSYIRYCFNTRPDATDFDPHCILMNIGQETTPNIAFHSVDKPFNFSGTDGIFFGDSICQGYTSGGTITPNGFPKLFSDAVGMTYSNQGQGGATISRVTGYPCVQDRISSIANLNDYEFAFIYAGVNDWQLGVSLSDFKTALQDTCDLFSAYTGKVFFIAPINEGGRIPNITPTAPLDDFRKAIKEICLANEFNFINGKLFDFPTGEDDSAYTNAVFGDKLHPSELGYRLITKGLKTALL